MDKAIVITTINPPKEEVYRFASLKDYLLVCVGDAKTPPGWHVDDTIYLSPKMQNVFFPRFSAVFPWKMYARKNLGYLYAIANKASVIYETDDDMLPYENFPAEINSRHETTILSGKKFINVYNYFTKSSKKRHPVWVRGFPLNFVKDQENIKEKKGKVFSPFINSVQDNDCDFDAVYRFLFNKRLDLKKKGSVALEKGSYAPVNTQSTFSFPEIYPLLYLPASPGFHVEDIIRGYINQRILWEMGGRALFIHPVARTNNRNPHDLLKDFGLEIHLYLKINKLIKILDSLSLSKDPLKSLLKVYRELVREEFFPKEETKMVEAWAWEIEKLL